MGIYINPPPPSRLPVPIANRVPGVVPFSRERVFVLFAFSFLLFFFYYRVKKKLGLWRKVDVWKGERRLITCLGESARGGRVYIYW